MRQDLEKIYKIHTEDHLSWQPFAVFNPVAHSASRMASAVRKVAILKLPPSPQAARCSSDIVHYAIVRFAGMKIQGSDERIVECSAD